MRQKAIASIEGGGQFSIGVNMQVALIEKLGITQLAKLASRWDQCYQHAERVCEVSTPRGHSGRWPTILKEPLRLGSLMVVPMASATALQAEGKRMTNCVSSYSYGCQRGTCQIWSLRDEAGTSIANLRTYVVDSDNGVKTVVIAELKAPENKKPSPEAIQSSELLLEAIKAHPEEFKQYLAWQTKIAAISISAITEAHYVRPTLVAMKQVLAGKYDLTDLFTEMLGEGEDLKRLVVEE